MTTSIARWRKSDARASAFPLVCDVRVATRNVRFEIGFCLLMSKTFRPWTIDQPLLLPPSVQDFVGEDHLARFILALVLEPLDLGEIEAAYASERGQPPFDPAMMTALLLYGYCNGVYSSRRIAKAAREQVDFLALSGSIRRIFAPSPTSASGA